MTEHHQNRVPKTRDAILDAGHRISDRACARDAVTETGPILWSNRVRPAHVNRPRKAPIAKGSCFSIGFVEGTDGKIFIEEKVRSFQQNGHCLPGASERCVGGEAL